MTLQEQQIMHELQETIAFLRLSLSLQGEQNTALTAQMQLQGKQIEALLEQNQQQAERIEELVRKIEELTNKGKDSHNSSKPPSSDGCGKKPAPKSLRSPSGKKHGGQEGHKGGGMKIGREPDVKVPHYPVVCENCANRGKCSQRICESRYVVDIEVKTVVTQHQKIECKCKLMNDKPIQGCFPNDVTATKQYGANITALASVLSTVGMMSMDRIHQVLSSIGEDLDINVGTVRNMLHRLWVTSKSAADAIREKVMNLPLLHCDETGWRVEGSLHWLHCACDSNWSYYFLHEKRGSDAINEMGVLPGYTGIMVHDCWSPYFKLEEATHALCGAHFARELVYAHENMGQKWADMMKNLLFRMLADKQHLSKLGEDHFTPEQLSEYDLEYEEIVQMGLSLNPIPERKPNQRGRIGKGKVRSLLERLENHKTEILRFIYDWSVPFTNNEAERSIRFSKVKQKVSGCFRTKTGASEYAETMSYINSARKHGVSYFDAVKAALNGKALALVHAWG